MSFTSIQEAAMNKDEILNRIMAAVTNRCVDFIRDFT